MPPPIFQLGPIKRRIYEVEKSGVEDDRLEIDVPTFRLQIGYQNSLANFRTALKAITGTDCIADYDLELVEDPGPDERGRAGQGRGGRRADARRRHPTEGGCRVGEIK